MPDSKLVRALRKQIKPTDSLLDLCCGNGSVLCHLHAAQIVGVDVHLPYLLDLQRKRKDIVVIHKNVLDIHEAGLPPFDIVSCVDGVEHLIREGAEYTIKWMEDKSRSKVLVFTPEGFTRNEPKNTWGIEGGDSYQRHQCGFRKEFFLDRGYKIIYSENPVNVYDGTRYTNNLYCLSKP
jgi:hypothetical protein